MLKIIIATLLIGLVISCSINNEREPVNPLESTVGHEVTENGIVTNSKHPHINGYGCWGLEDYRGKRVIVRGTVKKVVVTDDMVNPKDGCAFANEGPGVFYEIVQIREITVIE